MYKNAKVKNLIVLKIKKERERKGKERAVHHMPRVYRNIAGWKKMIWYVRSETFFSSFWGRM